MSVELTKETVPTYIGLMERCYPHGSPVPFGQFAAVVGGMILRNPDIGKCDPRSVLRSALDCAKLGLIPDARGHVHFVPYKKQCTLVIGYTGLIELMYRSGRVTRVWGREVRVGDAFDWDCGRGAPPEHRPAWIDNPDAEPGDITHAYACVEVDGRSILSMVMPRWQILTHRPAWAEKPDSIWSLHPAPMYIKTVVIALAKWVPQSPSVGLAISVDDGRGTSDEELSDTLGERKMKAGKMSLKKPEIVADSEPVPDPETTSDTDGFADEVSAMMGGE